MSSRKRRKFTAEFKEESVKLVTERGLSIAQASRDLDVGESTLSRWILQTQGGAPGEVLTWSEREELLRLRRENERLREEREILKMAPPSSLGKHSRNLPIHRCGEGETRCHDLVSGPKRLAFSVVRLALGASGKANPRGPSLHPAHSGDPPGKPWDLWKPTGDPAAPRRWSPRGASARRSPDATGPAAGTPQTTPPNHNSGRSSTSTRPKPAGTQVHVLRTQPGLGRRRVLRRCGRLLALPGCYSRLVQQEGRRLGRRAQPTG